MDEANDHGTQFMAASGLGHPVTLGPRHVTGICFQWAGRQVGALWGRLALGGLQDPGRHSTEGRAAAQEAHLLWPVPLGTCSHFTKQSALWGDTVWTVLRGHLGGRAETQNTAFLHVHFENQTHRTGWSHRSVSFGVNHVPG